MSDLISRADAIDAICDEWCYVTYGNCPHCDDGYKCDGCDDVKRLESLPSAEAYFTDGNKIAEWIPCSERLPSKSGAYLCTIPLDACETYTEVLTFYKGKFYEDDIDEWGALYHDDVLAWMPLPKPYREDGEA